MDSSVTAPTKREEIIQRIVAKFLRRSHSSAVNMVDVEILGGTTALTGEVVAFQSVLPVAAKIVIVLGFANVLVTLRAVLERLSVPGISQFLGAALAASLWTRTISEISVTLNTLKRCANCYGAFLFPQLTKMEYILLLPIRRATSVAALLRRASGFVKDFAHDTLTIFEAVASLAMGRQSTGLTPLEGRRSLRHLRSTIGAIKDAVFSRFHRLNYELSLP